MKVREKLKMYEYSTNEDITVSDFPLRHLTFEDIVKLLDAHPNDLSQEWRQIFPVGKERDPKVQYYLDAGDHTPRSDELEERISQFHNALPHGAGADHRSRPNRKMNDMMHNVLNWLGANDDALVVLTGSCTEALRLLFSKFGFRSSDAEGTLPGIVIPSRSYDAVKAATADIVTYKRAEIKIGKENGIRLGWPDISRSGSIEDGTYRPTIDELTDVVFFQAGSNMYGTTARLARHISTRTNESVDGIVEAIIRENKVRKRKGNRPIALIIDDAASRQCMGWRWKDSKYSQLRLDHFTGDWHLPVAIAYSAHKAYGVKGGIAVMNRAFQRLTSFKPKGNFEGKARWRQLLDVSGATSSEALITSLDYGTGLVKRIGIEAIMAHNIRMTYELVRQLNPLAEIGHIAFLSPYQWENNKSYTEAQRDLIMNMTDRYSSDLLLTSTIDPRALSFNTVLLYFPNKSSEEIKEMGQSLERYGLRVGTFDLSQSMPFAGTLQHKWAIYKDVIRLSLGIYNTMDDLEGAARFIRNRLIK